MTKAEAIQKAVAMYHAEGYIDIARLVTEEGINLYAVRNGDDFNASIIYNPVTKKFEIETNADHPEKRMRFSVAHELAHYILESNKIKEKGMLERGKHSGYDMVSERAADVLAGEILMPAILVNELAHEEGVEKSEYVKESFLNHMASRFKVSKQAAAIRLKQLQYNVVLSYVL